ncbi:Hypothetical protein HVR_LOCUS852 [uncultured virus]|nr:Hypothetical protein HVR_LOCUS852 [uncultured virus]
MAHEILKLAAVENVNSFSYSFISPDGSKIFAVLSTLITAPDQPTIAGILYKYDNEKLTVIKKINVPRKFPFSPSGAVSDDFTRLTLIFKDGKNKLLVNIYDMSNLDKPIRSFEVDGVYGKALSANGGTFSPDNRFIGITYPTTSGKNARNVLLIYDIKEDKIVKKADINGFSDGPVFFNICNGNNKRLYAVLGATRVNFKEDSDNILEPPKITFNPPSYVQIFEISRNFVTLVENIEAQNMTRIVAVSKYFDSPKVLIGVTFLVNSNNSGYEMCANKPSDSKVSPFIDNNDNIKGFESTNAGFKIYKFNGDRSKLVANYHSKYSFSGIGFSPNGKFLAVGQGSVPGSPDTLLIFKLGRYHDQQSNEIRLKLVDSPRSIPPTSLSIRFSNNGKYLLATGNPATNNNVNNIQLYKVIKQSE